jgi:hypothetical protein
MKYTGFEMMKPCDENIQSCDIFVEQVAKERSCARKKEEITE